jgi:hypothetical protein
MEDNFNDSINTLFSPSGSPICICDQCDPDNPNAPGIDPREIPGVLDPVELAPSINPEYLKNIDVLFRKSLSKKGV